MTMKEEKKVQNILKKSDIDGQGCGLFICKQICQKFDGDIDFNTKHGKGSKFTFNFFVKKVSLSVSNADIDQI